MATSYPAGIDSFERPGASDPLDDGSGHAALHDSLADAIEAIETALGINLTAVVLKSIYDANTILIATADNTPIALTIGASTFVGRKAAGDIVALTASEAAALLTSLVPK